MSADSGFPAKAIHNQGAAFVALGFDAVPTVDLDGQVDQVRRAWRYLVDNAAHFGLDPARGHLLGHGSGAHLAALVAFDPQAPTPVTAVLLSGVYDPEPLRRCARHQHLGLAADIAARLSPIRCIPARQPRVTVVWGALETACDGLTYSRTAGRFVASSAGQPMSTVVDMPLCMCSGM